MSGLDLDAAQDKVTQSLENVKADLRGNLITRVRATLCLEDSTAVPKTLLEDIMMQLNEELEQDFS